MRYYKQEISHCPPLIAGKGRVRFHCRFQKAVYECYRKHPRHISKAIWFALQKFRVAIKGGVINLNKVSRFLVRDNIDDKIEIHIRIRMADKDLMEKMAFSLRISQAEVLRMALEWYMEAIRIQSRKAIYYPAREKWHHRRPNPKLSTLRFSFWDYGRLLEWQIPPEAEVHAALLTIQDPDFGRFIHH